MFGSVTEKVWLFEAIGQTECVNRLLYMVEAGEAMTLLAGPWGTGKTTVLLLTADQLAREGWTVLRQNVASLDGRAALWHLGGALSISSSSNTGSSELMVQIRDELLARSACAARTAILLDDIDLAQDDIQIVLRLLESIAEAADGGVSLVAASERRLAASLQQRTSLSVVLEPLAESEARRFAQEYLHQLDCPADQILESGWRAIVDLSQGLPGQITRISQIVQAVLSIEHGPVDAALVVESARELLLKAA